MPFRATPRARSPESIQLLRRSSPDPESGTAPVRPAGSAWASAALSALAWLLWCGGLVMTGMRLHRLQEISQLAIAICGVIGHRIGHHMFKIAAAHRAGRWPTAQVWEWGCLYAETPLDPLPAATTTPAAVGPVAVTAQDDPSVTAPARTSADDEHVRSPLPSPEGDTEEDEGDTEEEEGDTEEEECHP